MHFGHVNDAVSPTLKDDTGRFKAAFDALLQDQVKAMCQRYRSRLDQPTLNALFDHLASVCTGGKRLRPFLVWRFYVETNKLATVEEFKELLLAVELFHIFCLIHDDVMDEAPVRHGVATLHAFTSAIIYDSGAFPATRRRAGESQAILVGDMVFNEVMRLLEEARRRSLPAYDQVRDIFHTLVEEVCLGQMLDIELTVRTEALSQDIDRKNEFKTARYSFVRPLQLGATLAGRSKLNPALERFGVAIGHLYQVQDDLFDIIGDPSKTKKPTLTDVAQNQHTVLTNFVRERGGRAAALLDQYCGQPLREKDKATLRAMFIECGAVAYAEAYILKEATKARSALDDARFTDGERHWLVALLNLVHYRSS
jgi:geranylgeranyl diphosphate synthase type I